MNTKFEIIKDDVEEIETLGLKKVEEIIKLDKSCKGVNNALVF